jgi:hypothetical protein
LGIGLGLWYYLLYGNPNLAYFHFGQYCIINRRILEKEVKQNEQCRTNSISAVCNSLIIHITATGLHPALLGKIGYTGRADKENSRFLLPISGVGISVPLVLARHKAHKRIGKAWKPNWHSLAIVSCSVLKGIVERDFLASVFS